MSILLENGLVYQAGQLQLLDILITADRITAIGKDLAQLGIKVQRKIDLAGKLVAPGLVDVHVHYREPGFTYKETIKTGSQAAAHGGFTTVCAMPNLDPVPDNAAQLQDVQERNANDGIVHIKQYASITQKRQGEQLTDFKALKKAGAFAFSDDGSGIQTAGTMYLAMKRAAECDMPLVEHIEDNSLLFGGVMNAGQRAEELNLPGMLGLSESSQLARDLLLAKQTGVHYHACHLSTKESVALIRWAKLQKINVTCEVAPHHLLLADADIPKDDPFYKMNPPLRSKKDQQALIDGLLDGTIDMIATDHAPHSAEEKEGSMCQASFGITGSETAFALLYTRFVKTGIFKLEQLLDWMSARPAQEFRIKDAGMILPGRKADLAVFDLKNEFELRKEDYLSKGTNTPFTGTKAYGATEITFVDGKIVYQKED
ncbi:dihydroorotase [Liquorilactobacillus sucicola DSM 21376 = JCM 15457]|uniref:Dihydroorotase n=1 Tax=Liquorilactobacillus sucicola DSM 21376 = JCM 15457 TaxID=1423806 RepID=A0A023CXA3_9LACO|nr:dihydroorotase [Liquorilactobacillus sucicola]KRN06221.1 dihydroorotase [Liquorilactobacillus sucicola DSM 21376 = JCM 15457]GAJ26155.1 dihydroorotase [Liquorilactobacillus sucicola DSM 21376 = JCM 15457]